MVARTAIGSTDSSRGPSPRGPTRDVPPVRVSDRTGSRALFPPVTVANRRLPTHLFGEAWLAWRCGDCGRVGSLAALPTACPDCGAPREALAYELED